MTEFTGWLDKKSGGKEGKHKHGGRLEHWDRRWVVLHLETAELAYYHGEADWRHKHKPSDKLCCHGATLVHSDHDKPLHFCVRASTRELRLRAATPEDYLRWTDELERFCSQVQGTSPHMREPSASAAMTPGAKPPPGAT